jgi:arginyl-tRNA---protein transferase
MLSAVWANAKPDREKRQKRDKFDLKEAIHRAEYSKLKRPEGKKSGEPIAPAHKFEVTLEADSSTKEKCIQQQYSSENGY